MAIAEVNEGIQRDLVKFVVGKEQSVNLCFQEVV